jgi:hypothetical protein
MQVVRCILLMKHALQLQFANYFWPLVKILIVKV